MKNKNKNSNTLEKQFQAWADEFLHSPVGFDGRDPQEIINIDIAESKRIFAQELPKRKAHEEIVGFEARDGQKLNYWFVEKPTNTKLKILLHGSGSNYAKADRAVKLLDRGFNVAMISYRGHSGNSGKADQKTIIKDVVQALKTIINQGYTAENIYLEGSSLGTSIFAHALNRLSQDSEFKAEFGGLILKAAPLNIYTRDKYTLESMKGFGLDYDKAEPLLKKLWNQEEPYSRIKAKEIKIVHGTKDDVVPVEHASLIKVLLEKNNSNVSLELIEGEGHRLDLSEYGIY